MVRRIVTAVLMLGTCLAIGAALPAARGAGVTAAIAAPAGQLVRTCQNIQLAPQPQASQGAAGTIVAIYRLHNLFGQACTLTGYPGLQLLDRNFMSLSTTVHRGLGLGKPIPIRQVRVAGHGNAFFTVRYSDVPVGNQPCETAFYLMIIPPNDFLPVVSYATGHHGSITPCSGNLYVSPVTAHPRFP